MVTFEEFIQDIYIEMGDKPKDWRKGQFVFNYIEENYGDVAREVQFQDKIDCFYNDDKIEEFIEACYKRLKDKLPNKKLHALMLFDHERNLGISEDPTKWVHMKTLKFGDRGDLALYAYANIPNPASQLIECLSKEELEEKELQMIENFQNQNWLNENIYPYI
jgi:hypothetical protein